MVDKLLQIFAKAPIQGLVKTRLIPDLGTKMATNVYFELLDRTLNLAVASHYKAQLWCTPNQQHEFFQQNAKEHHFILYEQFGKGLGERMQYALEQGLQEAEKVVLIGADCPVFTEAYLAKAFDSLAESDVVLGPAEDGGFVLIACRKTQENMFEDVEWGKATVLKQTMDAVERVGLTSLLLPELWDVDTPDDVKRWRASFAGKFK